MPYSRALGATMTVWPPIPGQPGSAPSRSRVPQSLTQVQLRPTDGVRGTSPNWLSSVTDPWLEIDAGKVLQRGGWFEIIYQTSFYDRLIRPVLRCNLPGGALDRFLPAPMMGSGHAVVDIPEGTQRLSICPTDGSGDFTFAISAFRKLGRRQVLSRAMAGRPARVIEHLGARLIGATEESLQALRMALSAHDLSGYAAWKTQRSRALDPSTLDSPRFDWHQGPTIRIILRNASRKSLADWRSAVLREIYPRISVVAVAGPSKSAEPIRPDWIADEAPAADLVRWLEPNDLILCVEASSSPVSGFASILAEAARDGAGIIYADAEVRDASGPRSPVLFTDWSRITGAEAVWGVHPVAIRADWVTRGLMGLRAGDVAQSRPIAGFLGTPAEDAGILHLRRVLLGVPPRLEQKAERLARAAHVAAPTERHPSVSIIIPTRNRGVLLAGCLAGLRERTRADRLEVVIVDNGSTEPLAKAVLTKATTDPRFTVVKQPGPFNFSALSNAGAAASKGEVLVFLNNDVEVIDPGWLDVLLGWIGRPEIGAVGACLLYPDGTVQHDGMVLGVGGTAGHMNVGRPAREARAELPREVTAVTGACLAVRRDRFDAVGGFDAQHLPVDLNDVDLCLRLREKGWVNIVADCTLVHHESASRGRTLKPSLQYGRERRYMRKRWWRELRDDPFFHPALSLYAAKPALG